MSIRVINVPKKNSDIKIKCKSTENGFQVYTSEGWEICRLSNSTPQELAKDIESILTKIRDIGFDQGREYIRNALGINN